MKIGLIAMSGVRVRTPELAEEILSPASLESGHWYDPKAGDRRVARAKKQLCNTETTCLMSPEESTPRFELLLIRCCARPVACWTRDFLAAKPPRHRLSTGDRNKRAGNWPRHRKSSKATSSTPAERKKTSHLPTPCAGEPAWPSAIMVVLPSLNRSVNTWRPNWDGTTLSERLICTNTCSTGIAVPSGPTSVRGQSSHEPGWRRQFCRTAVHSRKLTLCHTGNRRRGLF